MWALVGVAYLLTVAITVVAVVDVARRPPWAFQAAFMSQAVLLVALIVFAMTGGVGFLAALYYFIVVRPLVREYEAEGPVMSRCPFCQRTYPPNSIFCVYCSRYFDSQESELDVTSQVARH